MKSDLFDCEDIFEKLLRDDDVLFWPIELLKFLLLEIS